MKLITFFMVLGTMCVYASGYAQRVTLSLNNSSLERALKSIGKQSGYHLLYNPVTMHGAKPVSVKLKNKSLEEALTDVFKDQPLQYTINKKTIVVKEKPDVEKPVVSVPVLKPEVMQQRRVAGTVTDSLGTVQGVSVFIKGDAGHGTTTDAQGKFTLEIAKPDAVLVLTMVGYETQEVAVAGRTDISVQLRATSSDLDEVVVVGYGTQRKRDLTGAVAKIGEKEIEERPIARIEQALQGQMAGVAVRNTSGAPGAGLAINVRGAASISGSSEPLYVVDGVPLDNLSGINPSDIASIEVLKDASSAAIYGSRGSNGVILVSTKRGKIGKPVLSVSAYTAIADPEKHIDVMSGEEWLAFNKKWLDRTWTNVSGMGPSVGQDERIAFAEKATGKQYRTRAELATIRGTYGIYDPYWEGDQLEFIDWQDELLRTAPVNDVQVNASGANDIVNYSISGGFYDQQGIMVGSSYKRYSFRGNMEAKVNDKIKVGLSIAPSSGNLSGPNMEGNNNAIARMVSLPGVVLAGTGRMAGASPSKFYDGWGPGPNVVSPYVQAVYNDRINKDVRMNSAFNTDIELLKGLHLNGLVGWNYRGNTQRTHSPTWIQPTWDAATPGELSSSRKTTLVSNTLLLQATANYSKEVEEHYFNVLAGASQETYNDENTDQGQRGFPNDKTYIFDMSRGTTTTQNTIYASKNGLISYFARLQYRYKDRYLLNGSVRMDGSSKFGPNSRWGTFPALSAGWMISEEPFVSDLDWLGTTKLRVSWGQVGNDRIVNSAYLSSMGALNYPFGDNQDVVKGFIVDNISNSNLKWEKTDSYNIGLDLGFFQNRVTLSTDVYYKKTTDLLLNMPVSLTTGFSNMFSNVGSVDNKGVEFELRTSNILKPDFSWNTSLNISINRNKITSLANDGTDIRLGQGNTIIQRVGSPINSYYLLKAIGVLRTADFTIDEAGNYKANVPIYSGQRPGDTKYEDINQDGKIDANDYSVAGNYQPKFEFGVSNTFNYKNWDLSVLINGRVGGDLLSIGSRSWNRATNDPRYNYMASWLHDAYWSEEEPGSGKVPAFFSAVTSQYDTNWMYSAAYLRIRNINLGYNIKSWEKVFSNFRVYASCDNVFLWDSFYPGYSPEGATQDNASSDWGSYPMAKTFSFGINATF